MFLILIEISFIPDAMITNVIIPYVYFINMCIYLFSSVFKIVLLYSIADTFIIIDGTLDCSSTDYIPPSKVQGENDEANGKR